MWNRIWSYRRWKESFAKLCNWYVTCYRPFKSTWTNLTRVYELYGCIPQWKLGTKFRNRWMWVLVAYRARRTVRDADAEKSGRGGLWVGWRSCERASSIGRSPRALLSALATQPSAVCFSSKTQHLPLTGRIPLSLTRLLLVFIVWINRQLRN